LGSSFTSRQSSESESFDLVVGEFFADCYVSSDVSFASRRVQFATLASHYRLPVIYNNRRYAEVGGLMTYGPNLTDLYRQLGAYTGRILKGEAPANLPVIQPTRFELVINQHSAKTLGLIVPSMLLAVADEVIE
jgi:putative tryptophan/tyrosine transport system substrate-binding protein